MNLNLAIKNARLTLADTEDYYWRSAHFMLC